MADDPGFDLEQDAEGRAVVVLTCPECGWSTRRLMSSLPAGTELPCPDCGAAEWVFEDDGLADLGAALDDLDDLSFDVKL